MTRRHFIDIRANGFTIPAAKVAAATAALNKIMSRPGPDGFFPVHTFGDADGNIVDLVIPVLGTQTNYNLVFNAIAPFVNAGGWAERFEEETHRVLVYTFDGKALVSGPEFVPSHLVVSVMPLVPSLEELRATRPNAFLNPLA